MPGITHRDCKPFASATLLLQKPRPTFGELNAGASSLPWPLHLWGSGTAQWWPTSLLTSAAGFLAWWTSACWVLFTLIVLFLHKLGMINT